MKKKDSTICNINGCTNPGYVKFYGKYACLKCWSSHCSNNTFNLKKALRIKENPIKTELGDINETQITL